eukprot:TRINITY_DN91866_c0_g1_i1.p1 TRINITY_DN91866_c0_g1~~TRINITY_DN91866_c0_g1_i1.p1  ORF type:complete len:444 (+),score=73.04 TRINITY_DN91866_c0_g1_i1:83-1414(+)
MVFGRAEFAIMYLGTNTLLPYNSLITAQPWFDKYPFVGLNFPFTSMIVYSLCLCSSQIYLTFKGDGMSVHGRMAAALGVGILTCVAFFGIVLACGEELLGRSMCVPCLLVVAVMSISNSVLQTGLFGVTGSIRPALSAAAMLGMGVSGLVSFFVALLVQAVQSVMHVDGDSEGAGMVVALVLFAICTLHTISCCWVYFAYLRVRLPETAEALASLEERRSPPSSPAAPHMSRERIDSGAMESVHLPSSECAEAQERQLADDTWQRLLPVLHEVAPQALNVWSVFVVTMTVFPSVMIHWNPGASSVIPTRQLYDTALIGTFQVGDVLGRYLASCVSRILKPRKLWLLVFLRFVFIPLFMLGQRAPASSALWGSDAGRFLLCSLLAISNGLAANLAMMYGPECVSAPERREVAGMAMSAVMVTGIFCGTMLAFATQIGVSQSSVM